MAALALAAAALGSIIAAIPDGGLLEIVIAAAILLAQKSLVEHVRAVADALRLSLGDGRRMVARIVGRDTATMTEPEVARAAIESAAENLSDGVIAPRLLPAFRPAGPAGLQDHQHRRQHDRPPHAAA